MFTVRGTSKKGQRCEREMAAKFGCLKIRNVESECGFAGPEFDDTGWPARKRNVKEDTRKIKRPVSNALFNHSQFPYFGHFSTAAYNLEDTRRTTARFQREIHLSR